MSARASIPAAASASVPGARPAGAEGWTARSDHDHLLDRLQNLRTIVPVLATELAAARRQAAQLRVENRKLTEQLRRTQANSRARASASTQRVLSAKLAREGRAGVARRPSTRPL
ncbi:MAG TPA: hypothetical protein VLJ80_09440 [Solirubrobacteraceae bacterium]|nr:hypothetical protein [Solirubrobacteraceae bacterium]